MNTNENTKPSKTFILYYIVAVIVQFLPPLLYLYIKYDIYKYKEAKKSLTFYGILILIIIFILAKKMIKELIVDFNKFLSTTHKRSIWGFTFIILALFLALSSLWIQGVRNFLFVLGIFSFLSLIFYAPYDKAKAEYDRLLGIDKK